MTFNPQPKPTKPTCTYPECNREVNRPRQMCQFHKQLAKRIRTSITEEKKNTAPPKKKPVKLKQMSDKGKQRKKDLAKVRAEIWEERPHLCESCGCNGFGTQIAMSHIISKAQSMELHAAKENITLACSECHERIELRDFDGMLNEVYLRNYFQNWIDNNKINRI